MAMILRPPNTPIALLERLGSLARWQRFWSISTGLCHCLAFLAFLLSVAVVLDVEFAIPPAFRALVLAVSLGGAAVLLARGVGRPLRAGFSPHAMAHLFENRHPELNDALASAASFLGSPTQPLHEFQAEAVRSAEASLEPATWNRAVPLGRFWRAFWLVVIAGVALMTVAIVEASRLPTSLVRLLDPWGHHDWPARTRIASLDYPARIAIGEGWPLRMTLEGEIPETATIEIRNLEVNADSSVVPIPIDDAAGGGIVLDASRVGVRFEFRVQAGDAASGWQPVAVEPPPRLVAFDGQPSPRLRLDYPAYTGWTPLDLPAGSVAVETVAGTRITFRAAADRPIARASLIFTGDTSTVVSLQIVAPVLIPAHPLATALTHRLAEVMTAEIPVAISGADRSRLAATFIPPLSGVYTLRLIDDTGLAGQRLLDLRCFADPTPAATLLRPDPVADVIDRLITQSIPLHARGDDRTFALKALALEYRFRDEPWQQFPLIDLSSTARLLPALVGGSIPFTTSHPPSIAASREVAIASLSRTNGTPPAAGDTLTLRAVAWDWDDVTLAKEPGRSREVTLQLHTAPSLDAELQRGLAALRDALRKAIDDQVDAARSAPDAAASKAQASVRERLAEPVNGLQARAERLQATVRTNELPVSATTARLEAFARSLSRVEDKLLPAIEDRWEVAKRSPDNKRNLDTAQAAALAELRTAAAELDRWAGLAELQSEAHALSQQIRKTGEQSSNRLKDIAPGHPVQDLPPSQRAALERAANEHTAAMTTLNDLVAKAEKVYENKAADPAQQSDADRLARALQTGAAASAGDDLRRAAADLRANRTAAAEAARNQAQDHLRAVEAALAGQSYDVDELKKRQLDHARQLEDLQSDQNALFKKAQSASTPAERRALSEDHLQLRRKTERLAEAVAATDPAAAKELERAAEAMTQAADQLADGRDGSNEAQAATADLAKAKEQLRTQADTKPELVGEKSEALLQVVKGFRDRQQAAFDESLRLSEAARKAGRWERPLVASLVALSEREDSLAKELRRWAARGLAETPVFNRLAELAAERMEQTSARLADRKDDALMSGGYVATTEAAADEAVRRPLREALRHLDQIVTALSETPKPPTPVAQNADPSPSKTQESGKPKTSPLAQLKALRAWQADLQNRTTEFANAHPEAAKLSDDDRAQLSELQQAQSEIAKLFESLRGQLTEPEETP